MCFLFCECLINEDKLNSKYLFYYLNSERIQALIIKFSERAAQAGVNPQHLKEFKIPLPSLEVQQEIVEEVEGYQKIIDGCKQVIENYKPTIDIDPSWEMVELGEVCDLVNGYAFKSKDFVDEGVQLIRMGNVKKSFSFKDNFYYTRERFVFCSCC